MKASEVIQAAFDNHYRQDTANEDNKEMFMCHAIARFIEKRDHVTYGVALDLSHEYTRFFMPLIETQNTNCLHNYLRRTSRRYKQYSKNDYTPFCIKMRANFWLDLIADLKEKGL